MRRPLLRPPVSPHRTLSRLTRTDHPRDFKGPKHPPLASQEKGARNKPKGRREDAASLCLKAPREPHRPTPARRDPCHVESPRRPHLRPGPAPWPRRGPRPSGRGPAHRQGPRGPRGGAERKVRPAQSTALRSFSSVSKKLTSKIRSPRSPQLQEQRQTRLDFRGPAGQPNALKDGGFPGSPCGQVGVAADALAKRCSPRTRRYRSLPQFSEESRPPAGEIVKSLSRMLGADRKCFCGDLCF